jgi:hypothetical protein
VTEELSQQSVDWENAWWFVVPKIAVESLPFEEALTYNQVGGLVTSDGVADVGDRSEEDEKQCRKKPAAGAFASGARTIRSVIYHNLHAYAAANSE